MRTLLALVVLMLAVMTQVSAQIRTIEPPAQYAAWFDELKAACTELSKSCPTPVRPRLDKRQGFYVEFNQIQWRTVPGRTLDCRRDHGCYGVAEIMVGSFWNDSATWVHINPEGPVPSKGRWEFVMAATVTLAEDVSNNELVVKHEMLHLLMATSDHPDIFRELGVDSRSISIARSKRQQ